MKTLIKKAFVLILSLFLTACGAGSTAGPEPTPEHVHSFTKAECENASVCTECGLENEPALGHTAAIGVCSRCGEIVDKEHLEKLRQDMMTVAEIGSQIPGHFMNIDDKGAAEHYSAFTASDPLINEYNEALEHVLEDCEGYDELSFMAYQIQLMMNRTPGETTSAEYNYLADKTDEFIHFLIQFASSINYCTDEINALYGKKGTLIGNVRYFEEVKEMPLPDNAVYNINYLSEDSGSGEKRYHYVIADDSDHYDSNFQNYLFLLDHSGWLSVEKNGSEYHVIKNGRPVSVIRYEKNTDSQPVMTVVFPE